MRTILAILALTLAACADAGGPATPAPSGISAVHVNGDTRGGGADPIFSAPGAYGRFGLGRTSR